ncbi:hypothetical protein [Arthrobacter bambusae]|uniref:Lipoprotein n=1 Tax=Arthrobacter bambusae TaxID=1338426 RepID=A0AAW8DH35_9MICC|nr:hypothetical protein [Arthrobacter bambusae]MDP9904554.1 hypothetical protein [Arthrobacter bambusae]MDQ0129369.1 hypothetical protein [Arthrobacter bambusae]MDQ0181018.1 hypothetical protein [Arthrobacter bambusae]
MTTTTKRRGMPALAIGAAALMLALAGCSGGSTTNSKTEYVASTGSGGGALGVITVDGKQVSMQFYYCNGTTRVAGGSLTPGTGKLDDSRTHVTWTTKPNIADNMVESMTVTDTSVSYSGSAYTKRGGDDAKAIEANLGCKL